MAATVTASSTATVFPRVQPPDLDPAEDDLEFQITDWYLPESDRAANQLRREAGYPPIEGDPPEYMMYMYGVTADGHSVAVRVTDFKPYFYVKVPDAWLTAGANLKAKAKDLEVLLQNEKVKRTKIDYTTKKRQEYFSYIIPPRLRDHLEYVKVIHRKEFMGFTNGELFAFLKIRVKSHALFNLLKRFFMEPAQTAAGYKLYESNIDPFLRFIHERNLRPCGWVRLAAGMYQENEVRCSEDDETVTRAGYNLQVSANHVYALDVNKIAPLLIVSFDLECTSSHGDFPVAKKDYTKMATDLGVVAKYDASLITPDNVVHWIADAFTKDTYIGSDVLVNRVYPLNPINRAWTKSVLMPLLVKHAATIVRLILATAVKGGASAAAAAAAAETSETASDIVTPGVKKTGGAWGGGDADGPLADLAKFLTKMLPKLAGDAIIQIGTTVTRFGSDDILYKNVITLRGCDPIPGADVMSYDAEDEVILAWKDLIARLDPDIITGFNIFGFDMKYVWDRAEELEVADRLAVGLGRMRERQTILDKKELSSAALGDNVMYFFDMDGVVPIDMLKVMQRDHKLDSYKLDSVATTFLGDKKDDISPRDIFEKFGGSDADRCDVARYCIQDCALVNRLIHKLKILENNVGMGNVCSVPLSYLFMRGQGIKIFSLVAKEARLKQHLIPVIGRSYFDNEAVIDDEDGYEGAIVLDPEEGMYLDDPIVVLDYNSLYPSSMISRNLSHDSYVADPTSKYGKMEDKGITYQTITYDVFEGKGDAKRKVGEKSSVFAQFPEGKKGIIPSILQNLLQQRKNTRKRMEYERLVLSDGRVAVGLVCDAGDGRLEIVNVDKADVGAGFGGHKAIIDGALVVERREEFNVFEQAVLDALQLAYKVTANSLYGQTGSKTSPIYLKEIAACTTATGREMIYLAKNFVEERYDAKVIYGDSVTGYTPVIIRHGGLVKIETIENLAEVYGGNKWIVCKEDGKQDKESCEVNGVDSWTDAGWTKIHRVIRHALADTKKIIRINTHHGIVDVTDDHSLLTMDADEISPKDLRIGDSILHHRYPSILSNLSKYSEEEARIMGFFMGDGSCGDYDCASGNKCSFALNNADHKMLEMYLDLCTRVYPELNWKILDTLKSSGVYKLVPTSINYGSIKKLVTTYRELMYYGQAKIVPDGIMNANESVRESFWKGLYDADGDKSALTRIDQKNQISMATISFLTSSLGFSMSFNTRQDKPNVYRLNLTKTTQRKPAHVIKKMYSMDYTGFVYDLTTANHHFQAGVGEIITHNTDSIFIKFHHNVSGQKIIGKQALPLAIAAGQLVEKEIKGIMPAHQNLAYEKTMWPFIIFSKKRYLGNLYEEDPNKKPKKKFMGIVLKRRDNAPIVKKVYGGITDILLDKNDLQGSIAFLQSCLQEIVDGKVSLEDLIISKTLRATYKDPNKIAHKVLARRMGERDPGNKPQANDRIPYVFIKTPMDQQAPDLQGDRIEHPDYIRDENLTPDYYYYITNQLMKPITQIFALCVDQLPGYSYPPSYWVQMDEEMSSHRLYTDPKKRKDRIDVLKQREVEELLFEPYLRQIAPERIKPARGAGGGTCRKRHALDIDPRGAAYATASTSSASPALVPVQYVMTIKCTSTTKPKRYIIDITLVADGSTTKLHESRTESKQKKYGALISATERAFKTIADMKEVREQGHLRIITDKLFVTRWKTAYNTIDTLREKEQAFVDSTDTGSFGEAQEMKALINIIGFHETIKYTLEAFGGEPETEAMADAQTA